MTRKRSIWSVPFWTPDAVLPFAHIRIVHSHAGHGTTGKGDVTFDNFVQACVSIKSLTDSFRRFDTDGDGWIQIKYEDVSVVRPTQQPFGLS